MEGRAAADAELAGCACLRPAPTEVVGCVSTESERALFAVEGPFAACFCCCCCVGTAG